MMEILKKKPGLYGNVVEFANLPCWGQGSTNNGVFFLNINFFKMDSHLEF